MIDIGIVLTVLAAFALGGYLGWKTSAWVKSGQYNIYCDACHKDYQIGETVFDVCRECLNTTPSISNQNTEQSNQKGEEE